MSENTISTILGRKGMGKTTLTMEMIASEPRVIVLDTMGGYGRVCREVVWNRDDSIRAILKASKERRFRLACRVISQYDMLDVLDMAWEIEDYTLVLEETSLVCGTPPYLHEQLGILVRYGRHRRISQIYIARRPTELPRDLTAQSDLIVTFHQKEPRDLAYLQACGFNPSEVVALRNDLPGRGTVAVVGDVPLPLAVAARLQGKQRHSGDSEPIEESTLTNEEESAIENDDVPEEATEGS